MPRKGVRRFRFLPRYRGVALTAMGVGVGIDAVSLLAGFSVAPLVLGTLGVALGAVYLLSPSWRLEVVIDDVQIAVCSPSGPRFQLAWTQVVKVVSSPSTHTCFVDGGVADRSLLVPGDGAPAPYDLENKPALCAEILARVAPDRIQTVELLTMSVPKSL